MAHFWVLRRSYDPPTCGVYLGGSKKREKILKVFFKLENGVLSFFEILCIFRKYKGFPKNLKLHFLVYAPLAFKNGFYRTGLVIAVHQYTHRTLSG